MCCLQLLKIIGNEEIIPYEVKQNLRLENVNGF